AFVMSERHQVDVAAPPAETYQAVRELDLARSRSILLLLAARAGLALLTPRRAVAQYGPLARRRRLTLDDVVELGFVLLDEQPGEEIVLGAVGRFWRPASGILRVDAEEFRAFDEPGFAKAALNLRVEPRG